MAAFKGVFLPSTRVPHLPDHGYLQGQTPSRVPHSSVSCCSFPQQERRSLAPPLCVGAVAFPVLPQDESCWVSGATLVCLGHRHHDTCAHSVANGSPTHNPTRPGAGRVTVTEPLQWLPGTSVTWWVARLGVSLVYEA